MKMRRTYAWYPIYEQTPQRLLMFKKNLEKTEITNSYKRDITYLFLVSRREFFVILRKIQLTMLDQMITKFKIFDA